MRPNRKWGCLILLLPFILLLGGCSDLCLNAFGGEERHGPAHYQYTYEVIDDWNHHAIPQAQRDDLFGYDEYLYNSYMALFPRETPSTLKEYYFGWERSIDADDWAVYFTCALTEENYAAFADGLSNFSVATSKGTVKPLLDTTHFPYPTYILQWLDVGEKWEVLEYVMLDESKHTAVFVYTMGNLENIESHSAYDVTPTTMNLLAPEDMHTDYQGLMAQTGFTIYEGFQGAEYDLSFIEYLK